jgi:hypothetical protein
MGKELAVPQNDSSNQLFSLQFDAVERKEYALAFVVMITKRANDNNSIESLAEMIGRAVGIHDWQIYFHNVINQ